VLLQSRLMPLLSQLHLLSSLLPSLLGPWMNLDLEQELDLDLNLDIPLPLPPIFMLWAKELKLALLTLLMDQ
jgi:hypothetical protein